MLLSLQSCSNDNRLADFPENEINPKISSLLNEINKIKPGMHRSELNELFTTEGGISTRIYHVYVLKKCMFVKVQVRFLTPTINSKNKIEEESDIIESIGVPYLELPVGD